MAWSYTALTDRSVAKFAEIISDNGFVFINGNASSQKTLNIVASGFTPTSYKWYKKNSNGTYDEITGATSATYVVQGVSNIGTYKGSAFDGNEELSDYVTIDAVSDGTSGSSPYLFSVSNENFSISTDNSLKPTSALNYDITITGYHGSALMTPVAPSATLASGQYKVACSSNLFALQNDNKTLRFTTDTATALASANQSFTVTVSYYNDSTSSVQTEEKIITVSASKNGVDGVSPTATVSRSGSTTTITITDKSGTTSETVSDGANGVDSYSCNASTDAIIIATDTSLKPLSATATNVVFKCFKGTTALTAVASSSTTVGANQFRVTTPSDITGITFAQSTDGTLTVTPSTSTAIGANTSVSITVAIGSTSNTVTKTLRIVAAKQGNASTVPGPSGQRAIRYLGKSSTQPNSNNQTSAPSGISTPIVGDWYLCSTDGYVYYCTAISGTTYTWSKLTCTSGVPDYRITAAIEDMIDLVRTITTNTTLNYVVNRYVECLIIGTAFVDKLFANTANVEEINIKDMNIKNDGNNFNISIGKSCLADNTTGKNNIAIGSYVLDCNASTCEDNIVFGKSSARNLKSGKNNIILGNFSYTMSTSNSNNIGIGNGALLYSKASNNIAIGTDALKSANVNGVGNNIAIGGGAGQKMERGYSNILFGDLAGQHITDGYSNIIIGDSDVEISTGANNVIIGQVNSLKTDIDENYNQLTLINNAIKHYDGKLYSADTAGDFKEVLTTGGKASTAGTADNADKVNILTSNSSGDYPLLFTSGVTAGNKNIYTDTVNEISYNPSTNEMKVGGSVSCNGYQLKTHYEIDASSLSTSNFYPVIFGTSQLELDCEIHSPSGIGGIAYNQNIIHFLLTAQGRSDLPKRINVLQYGVYASNEITLGSIAYGNQGGVNCIWVRGGMKYQFYCNRKPILKTADYTSGNEKFTVGTSYSGGTNSNVTIVWTPDTRFVGAFSGLQSGRITSSNASKSLCDTVDINEAGSTVAKTAYLPGFVLKKGSRILVNLVNANTVANATLNVSDTGAKTVYINGANSVTASNWTAGIWYAVYDGSSWQLDSACDAYYARKADFSVQTDFSRSNAYCSTVGLTQAKVASMRGYALHVGNSFPITFAYANCYDGKITLNINSTGAKDIWINGVVSSSSNKTLHAGTHMCTYDGSKYLIETSCSVPSSRVANSIRIGAPLSPVDGDIWIE